MQLLPKKTVKQKNKLQADEERLAKLKIQRKELEERKKMSEVDIEQVKEKKLREYFRWNQEIQGKKAILLQEIEFLEKKRDSLTETIKIHID